MKPYYEQDGITIYHGSCLEILPLIAPVDLIVTDPPYGVGMDYGEGTNDDPNAHWTWFTEVLAMMRECSPQVVFTHRQEALRHLTDWDHVCIWNKPLSMGFARSGWLPHWEPVFIYGGVVTNKTTKRAAQADLLSFNCQKPEHGHPAQKPLGLMKKIISTFTGDVCDPFCGSGTTLRAAKDLGRRAIGIEIEERYAEIAANRLAQGVLFGVQS